jgi:urea transporter
MAATHARLGLGEFPRAPVVDYLARSIAALYGFHGVLVLIVSTDPIRYRPIVWFIAVMNVFFGLMIVAIDLHAGLPAFWTALEGPPIVAFGVVIAVLNRRMPAEIR